MFSLIACYLLFALIVIAAAIFATKSIQPRKKIIVGELCLFTIVSVIPFVNIVALVVAVFVICGSYDIMRKELF